MENYFFFLLFQLLKKITVYKGKDILIFVNFKFYGFIYQEKVIIIDWKNFELFSSIKYII